MVSVHVLGVGSMGGLFAHELASCFPEIIPTLLFKNRRTLDWYNDHGSQMTIVRANGPNVYNKSQKLNATLLQYLDEKKTIDNLVVSTKLHATEKALEPYIPLLNGNSNILLLQNGMGMTSSLVEKFWPQSKNTPNFFQAVTTHGAYKTSINEIHHASQGSMTISQIPIENQPLRPVPKFIEYITKTESLNAKTVPYEQFLLIQMEKLVVNACINPLTAILDCFNGDLLYGSDVVYIMRKVVRESILVFFEEFPILKSIPESGVVLSEERLLESVLRICKLTSQNSSSMREDMRNLRLTEVDWINGYINRLGKKHSIPTPENKILKDLVQSKSSITTALDRNAANLVIA